MSAGEKGLVMGAEYVFDGRTARSEALASFEERRARYPVRARQSFVRRLLEIGETTVNEIRNACPIPRNVSASSFGAVPTPFVHMGIVARTGFRPATSPECHASNVSAWRFVERGWALAWLADSPEPAIPESGQRELFAESAAPNAGASWFRYE